MLTPTQAEAIIGAADDVSKPANGTLYPKHSVAKVHKVFEPDRRGLTEVLYRDTPGECLTAYIDGNKLSYVEEGW